MCFHGRKFRVEIAFYQLAGFFHRALHQHAFKTAVDLLIEFCARWGQRNAHPFILLQDRRLAVALEVGQRFAGRQINLIGACEALAVAGAQSVSDFRIDRGQSGTQAVRALGIGNGAHVGADIVGYRGNIRQALSHCEQVKAGAADQDSALAAQFKRANGRADLFQPLASGVALGRVHMAEEMVLHTVHLFFGRAS